MARTPEQIAAYMAEYRRRPEAIARARELDRLRVRVHKPRTREQKDRVNELQRAARALKRSQRRFGPSLLQAVWWPVKGGESV